VSSGFAPLLGTDPATIRDVRTTLAEDGVLERVDGDREAPYWGR
jgi:hypothetical protein